MSGGRERSRELAFAARWSRRIVVTLAVGVLAGALFVPTREHQVVLPASPARLTRIVFEAAVAPVKADVKEQLSAEPLLANESPISVPVPPPEPAQPKPMPKLEVTPEPTPEKRPAPEVVPPKPQKVEKPIAPRKEVREPPTPRVKKKQEAPKPLPKEATPAVREPVADESPQSGADDSRALGASGAASAHASAATGTAAGGSRSSGSAIDEGRELARLVQVVDAHKAYPRRARINAEQGRLVLRVTLDEAGRVRQVSLATSHPSKLLQKAALDAGKPLIGMGTALGGPRDVLIPVVFTLDD